MRIYVLGDAYIRVRLLTTMVSRARTFICFNFIKKNSGFHLAYEKK